MSNTQPLIRLEGITKVFHTDEIETHALSEVHLEIQPGEFLSIAGPSGCERKKRVKDVLDRVGMAHRANHYPAQLSGGQQQRVAVARALGGQPSILLADEPTGNLDSKNSEAVVELLRQLHMEGATICMVTHDSRYAEIADRTIHLLDGRIA